MIARLIALVVGAFYLVVGAWAFLMPDGFYNAVATFVPFNRHLLHDGGAFQVGLGLALLLPTALRLPLRLPLLAVLAASLLHLLAHVEDARLGGHPATDLPALSLVCLALAAGVVLQSRGRPSGKPKEEEG